MDLTETMGRLMRKKASELRQLRNVCIDDEAIADELDELASTGFILSMEVLKHGTMYVIAYVHPDDGRWAINRHGTAFGTAFGNTPWAALRVISGDAGPGSEPANRYHSKTAAIVAFIKNEQLDW